MTHPNDEPADPAAANHPDVDALRKEAQKLQAENLILAGQLRAREQEIEAKNRQIHDLFRRWEESDLSQMHKQAEELRRKIASLEKLLAEMNAKHQQSYIEFNQKNQKIVDLSFELQEKIHAGQLQEVEKERLKKFNAELQEEVKRLYSEDFSQSLKSVKDQEIRQLQEKLTHLLRQAEAHAESSFALQEKAHAFNLLQAESEQQKKIIQGLEAELDRLKGDDYARYLESLKENEINLLRERLSHLSAAAAKQSENMKALLKQEEERSAEMKQRWGALEEERNALKEALRQKEEDLARLLEQTDQEKALAAQEAAARGKEAESLAASLSDLRRQFDTLQEERSTLIHTLSEAQKQNEETSGLIAKLTEKLSEAESRFASAATAVPAAPAAADASPLPRRPGKSIGEAAVLVAESNPETLQALCQTLEKEGARTLAASDGGDVVAAARNEAPDLIVMDVTIGGMDSFSVCRVLAEEPSTRVIPVILVASNPASTEIFREKQGGAGWSYLYKPFSLQEFTAAVSAALK